MGRQRSPSRLSLQLWESFIPQLKLGMHGFTPTGLVIPQVGAVQLWLLVNSTAISCIFGF